MGGEALELEAGDVVKVVLQFCKENGLTESFRALSRECQVSLNTVDNVESFVADINSGRWDAVLPVVAQLEVPRTTLEALYEQVVIELAEVGEVEAAAALLRQSAVLAAMKRDTPERHLRLDRLVQHGAQFDPREAYGGVPKERRRAEVARLLSREVSVVPPSRLLTLIGQALKWQQHTGALPPGTAFDVFRGAAPALRAEDEECPSREARHMKFGKKSFPQCAAFSPDGQSLVTGSADGFLEVWDPLTAKLKKDLAYQADEQFMMHDEAVLSVAFSRDSEMLASGSQDGKIKVWKVATGVCLRRFEGAHSAGVTALCFSRDNGHVLSASMDDTARVHGLKSGKVLKEFRGHTSFVNGVAYSADDSRVFTASSDGTVRVWDARTGECTGAVRLPSDGTGVDPPVLSVSPYPKDPELLLVCNRSPKAYLVATDGVVVRTLSSGKAEKGEFVACAASPRGEWVYCLGEDGNLCCFSTASGKLEALLPAHTRGPVGVSHHPHANMVATFAADGHLKLWEPA